MPLNNKTSLLQNRGRPLVFRIDLSVHSSQDPKRIPSPLYERRHGLGHDTFAPVLLAEPVADFCGPEIDICTYELLGGRGGSCVAMHTFAKIETDCSDGLIVNGHGVVCDCEGSFCAVFYRPFA